MSMVSLDDLIEEYVDKIRNPSSKEIRKVYLCKLKKQIKEEDTSSSQYHKFMEWKRKQTNNNDLSEQLKQLQIENNNLKHKVQLLENNSDLSNINIVNNLLTQVNHLINPPLKDVEEELDKAKKENNSLDEVKENDKSIDNKELTQVNKKLTEQLEKEKGRVNKYFKMYSSIEKQLCELKVEYENISRINSNNCQQLKQYQNTNIDQLQEKILQLQRHNEELEKENKQLKNQLEM